MRGAATVVASALMLASAWMLYSESTATRRLEARVQATERQRERLETDIAVLRAERAWLSRPGRIEPAARALGMRMPQPGEYVDLEVLIGGGSVEQMERRR